MSIHPTAIIDKSAEVDPSAEIGPGVIIEGAVRIHKDVKLMANAYICGGTEIGEGTEVHMGAVIGNTPQDYAYKGAETFTKIGKNNIIREYVTIHRGTKEGTSTVVGDNNFIMVQAHLGHNCEVGNNVIIANGALLAGYVQVAEGAFISGNVVFHQFCRVGRYAMIGGFTGVNQDVPPYMMVRGPSVIRGINLVGLRRAGFKRERIAEVKDAYGMLFLSDMPEEEAVTAIKEKYTSEEISVLVSFIESSKRGICKYRYSREEYF
ncbi:MAG: acyl-ACP--UDP-N-acetylglucosamine O-acyltransferase [Candidatus Tantalella remota]|nr:acyl-ACP--UDP-N-acetylglucosamine O-acyltransferase [Candidatus Tantalella remota]